jgi:hypothetical protein
MEKQEMKNKNYKKLEEYTKVNNLKNIIHIIKIATSKGIDEVF